MIYLILEGRLGNQLFMYSHARKLQEQNPGQEMVIDDTMVRKQGYENLLPAYPLENVNYVHDRRFLHSPRMMGRYATYMLYRLRRKPLGAMQRYEMEKSQVERFSKRGVRLCENGYIEFPQRFDGDLLVAGYYQSDKYFKGIESELRRLFSLRDDSRLEGYPGIDQIRARNSVCLSIKVQHNVGNGPYDVCNAGYWQAAIEYILRNVEDPLFFVCSDDIEYVKEHLIDINKYDVVYQSHDFGVEESLAVMGMCKHFIIGNTTFGWWAQFLNGSEGKIVVAPSRWMNVAMPIDIYQDNWHLIEV